MTATEKTLVDQLEEKFGLRQMISGATTNYGSQLDWILTNVHVAERHNAWIYESCFSDHKPLVLEVNRTPSERHNPNMPNIYQEYVWTSSI